MDSRLPMRKKLEDIENYLRDILADPMTDTEQHWLVDDILNRFFTRQVDPSQLELPLVVAELEDGLT